MTAAADPYAGRFVDDLRAAAVLAAGPRGLVAASDDDALAVLYERWYLRGAAPIARTVEPECVPPLTGRLRVLHPARARWTGGWRAEAALPNGAVVGSRGPETARLFPPGSWWRHNGLGLPVRPGDPLVGRDGIEQPVERWWVATAPTPPTGPLLRLYLHARPGTVEDVVAAVLDALDGAPGWTLKALADEAEYRRADAVVAYLDTAAIDAAAAPLRDVAVRLGPLVRPTVPRCTWPLAPGVACAEDPGATESFGTQRCRTVLQGLRAAAPGADVNDRIAGVCRALQDAGLDPGALHRSPGNGTVDRFFGATAPRRRMRSVGVPLPTPVRALHAVGDAAALREAGLEIARRLLRAASAGPVPRWHGPEVTGASPEPVVEEIVLGDDVYSGRAGIAWFLAGAAAAGAGSADVARAAVRDADRAADPAAFGLLTGSAGIAVAASVADGGRSGAGIRLGDRVAAAVTRRLDENGPDPFPEGDDLLAGTAGTLLALMSVTGDRSAVVSRLAARLVQRARRARWGTTWPDAQGRPLCGLSHGAAGVALALTAAGVRLRDVTLLDAAGEAVRAEAAWFDDDRGWPDLRTAAVTPDPVLWCHGAAGIGTARLRQLSLLRGLRGVPEADRLAAECAAHATAAVHAGRAAATRLAPLVGAPGVDVSLCHGVSGLVELFLNAYEATGEPAHLRAARRLAGRVADMVHRGEPLPGGLPNRREALGLLIGLAGIGATLLRAADPAIMPSPALFGVP